MESIGHLEEMVLLLVMGMEEAYGVSVAQAYQQQTGQSIAIPTIHTVLGRLEEKGFLRSKMGEATAERGGRRKRLFEATPAAFRIIGQLREQRIRLWSLIPAFQ
jgi:PadR family transcriptional regulator, regulatory protein PadR